MDITVYPLKIHIPEALSDKLYLLEPDPQHGGFRYVFNSKGEDNPGTLGSRFGRAYYEWLLNNKIKIGIIFTPPIDMVAVMRNEEEFPFMNEPLSFFKAYPLSKEEQEEFINGAKGAIRDMTKEIPIQR